MLNIIQRFPAEAGRAVLAGVALAGALATMIAGMGLYDCQSNARTLSTESLIRQLPPDHRARAAALLATFESTQDAASRARLDESLRAFELTRASDYRNRGLRAAMVGAFALIMGLHALTSVVVRPGRRRQAAYFTIVGAAFGLLVSTVQFLGRDSPLFQPERPPGTLSPYLTLEASLMQLERQTKSVSAASASAAGDSRRLVTGTPPSVTSGKPPLDHRSSLRITSPRSRSEAPDTDQLRVADDV